MMGLCKIPLMLLLIFSVLHTRAASYKKNRRTSVEVDPSNNCYCFPNSIPHAPITDILDPNNHGLERLIVYLYKDLGTHAIKMYTPGKEKQHIIPDIPFETGDTLDQINTETIVGVFNSNPNKVITVNATEINKTEKITNIATEIHSGSEERKNKIDWIIHNETPDIDSAPFAISPMDVPNQFAEDEMLSHHPVHTDSKEISDAWHSHHYHNVPQHYDYAVGDSNDHVHPIDSHSTVETSIINSTVFNYNRNVNSKNYITFDKWFADQMAKFNALNGPTPANTIDIYTLKALTEKTLQENNIYVSVDGVLTDVYGTVMDYSNLMLRPILIGDLVAYQNVLKETNKFSLPTNSPYLEALLVTLVNPPKVLGIIPLGLAVLPSQSSRTSLPMVQTIPDLNRPERTLGKYSGRRIIPGYLKVSNNTRNSERIPTQNSNRRGSRIDFDYIFRKAKATRAGKDRRAHKASKNEVANDDMSDNSLIPKRPKLREILQNFFRLLRVDKKENKNQIDDYDSYEDISSEEEEDKHDFRIIGGNAATSSGTPINNKGRSGIIV